MMQINPLAGPLAQGAQIQRQSTADKTRQIRHRQDLQKNAAASEGDAQDQVENTEELRAIHDGPPKRGGDQKKRRNPKEEPQENVDEDDPPRLDLTA